MRLISHIETGPQRVSRPKTTLLLWAGGRIKVDGIRHPKMEPHLFPQSLAEQLRALWPAEHAHWSPSPARPVESISIRLSGDFLLNPCTNEMEKTIQFNMALLDFPNVAELRGITSETEYQNSHFGGFVMLRKNLFAI